MALWTRKISNQSCFSPSVSHSLAYDSPTECRLYGCYIVMNATKKEESV